MPKILYIAIFSFQDQIRQKSFYILLGVCILLVLLLRGCYQGGNFTINNQQVDSLTIARHASKLTFHLIAGGMVLLTTLLSMSIFTRDSQNGNMVLLLSKAVKRSDYVLGRVMGVWILVSIFMFILHLTIIIIVFMNTGDIISEFFLASVICTMNLLFFILLVVLFSLFIPDFIAALAAIGIAGISFISDSAFLIKPFISSGIENQVSTWRALWPKTAMLQHYASSLIGSNDFIIMGPVHPIFNILFYIFLSYFLLKWAFHLKEI